MIEAVIFDFDGVIGDTLVDNFYAWQKCLMTFDIQIKPIEYYLLEGMGRFEIARHFIKKHGINPSKENEIVELKEENYIQNNKFRIYPHILAIFDLLDKHNIKKGLVTGASRARLYKYMSTDILSTFSAIITSDDVSFNKPNPEPYIKALKKLNLNSNQCIIVENAPLGIEAAKSAGVTCFALETTLDRSYLTNADETFDSHLSLLNKINDLFEKNHGNDFKVI